MSGPSQPPSIQRLRIRFAKHGKVRFTSHRDVARIWERTLRKAQLPVAYSAGFVPRPKLAFGLALSTGFSSDAEYLDVSLDARRAADLDITELAAALSGALPQGMTALAVAIVSATEPSLQHAVTSCTWRIDAAGLDRVGAERAMGRALSSRELIIERKRKGRLIREDIRPGLLAVDLEGEIPGGVRLIAELGTQPRALRPAELLASLDPALNWVRVCRLHQWIATGIGERHEPLALARRPVAQAVAG